MLDLIKKPFTPVFEEFIASIETDCFICSPYITSEPVTTLIRTINKKRLPKISVSVLTDISFSNLVHGGTDISALLHFFKTHHKVSITYLPKLHAKVYIANQANAIVASANFTRSGAGINFEYGFKITDSAVVQKIHQDMSEYCALGANIDKGELESIQAQVKKIRQSIQAEQTSIQQAIRQHTIKQQRDLEDALIRVRVKNGSLNAIFSKTLLYLLSQHSATTKQLHQEISNIHPDLCDDIDRVIDGEHFGRLWKHHVRSAQQYLKKSGLIHYDGEMKLWQKTHQ